MKRKLLNTTLLKQTALAVPAAALMLGAAQAGTTVGLNFQAWYYDSGTTPQTVGFGAGYQTTGFPVTARAFGVAPSNWSNPDPLPCQAAISTSVTFGGTLTAQISAPNAWMSGIGELTAGFNAQPAIPEAVAPGNDEVTWGYLDDGNSTGQSPSVSVSGLAAKFPNGYVVQSIAAEAGPTVFDGVNFTDGVTTNASTYSTYYKANNPAVSPDIAGGTVGLSAQSGVFINDTISIDSLPKTVGNRSTLAAFIITDQPVVTQDPTNGTLNAGDNLMLSANAIGIPPLAYQWQHAGTNIPGATAATYAKSGASTMDAGSYQLVATNLYGIGTSAVATVTVLNLPAIITDLPSAATNYLTMNETFFVVAGGTQPLSYQWFHAGTNLPGATSAALPLTNVQAINAGTYQVIVTNSLGSATSSVVSFSVLNSQPPYDGFAYPAGSLTGQGGGIGWNGVWTQETNYNGDHSVFTPATPWRGGLSELVSTGGAVALGANGSADFEDIRNLETTLGGGSSGTLYISFVCQITNSAGWGGLELVNNGVAELFLGSCWYISPWGWGNRAAPDATTSVPASTLALLVYRFDFTPTNTAVRLYANPSSLAAEPATASASGAEAVIAFDQIRIVTHNPGPNGVLDEFRIGGTWAAVTPHIPRSDAPFALQIVPGGLIKDTKPVGIPHPGHNYGATWVTSITDTAASPVTRTGVEQFSAGTGSQITIPTNSDFNSANGTICFWMLAGAPLPGPGSEGAMLFDRRTTNGAVIVLHDDGAIFWQGQGGSQNAFEAGYVPDGNWHHVAVTFGQTTNDTISIYIDGALSGSTPITNGWSWPATQEIEIGRSHDPYWQRLDGDMDDFRIYNRVLTSAEVAQVFTSGALVDTSALKVQYIFDSAIYGQSLVWPFGTLISSSGLAPGATWTPVPGAVSPLPFEASQPELFYRLLGTP